MRRYSLSGCDGFTRVGAAYNSRTMTRIKALLAAFAALVMLACGDTTATAPETVSPDTPSPRTATPLVTPPSASQCRYVGPLPDPSCTPGRTNPDVTQATIAATICVKGWTRTIRPARSYTDSLKRRQMATYGDTDSPSAYEEDHLIPLELGGHPTDPANLWPQPLSSTPGGHEKDRLESYLRGQVCAGRIQLADVQASLASDWVKAWIEAGRP